MLYYTDQDFEIVERVTSIAKKHGRPNGQVALAWLLAQQPWIVPIPGTRRFSRLEENLIAADLELSSTDLDELNTASAAIEVQGERYPEAMQRMIDR